MLFAILLQAGDVILAHGREVGFTPFLIIGTAGSWIIGLIVRARTSAQDELYARPRDLEAEPARYVQESVRYERTRPARELHDIVARNVSLMVVQASAGQVLATRDSPLVRATFAYQMIGTTERVDSATAQIAYRVVQEALTNALKHGPGAPIAVRIVMAEYLDVQVSNDPAQADSVTGAWRGRRRLADRPIVR